MRGETSVAKASGDGGYDAFMRALEKAVKRFGLALPRLADYRVRIPPGGRTGALVQTVITWQDASSREGTFSTLAVDSDQLAAAVLATEKMLNVARHAEEGVRARAVLRGRPLRPRLARRSRHPVQPQYQPVASVLEVVATLRRHLPDDTYRFEPAATSPVATSTARR